MRAPARARVVLVAASCVAGWAVLAAAPGLAAQTLVLDLSDPANASAAGALRTAPLAKGEAYRLTVSGTGSVWPATEPSALCGRPEAAVMSASPGKLNGPAGFDAQTLFGAPAGSVLGDGFTCASSALPRNSGELYTAFEIAPSPGSWTRPVPVGGQRKAPRTDHTYVFPVTGTGAPLALRFVDTPSDDNYGRLGITLTTAAECVAVSCEGSAGGSGFQAGRAGDLRAAALPLGDPAQGSAKRVRTCAQTLPVKAKTPAGQTLKRVTFKAGGRTVGSATGRAARRAITLRRLPSTKTFTLTATATTTAGRTLRAKRQVAGCRAATKRATTVNLRR